jgi:hypothetical protein
MACRISLGEDYTVKLTDGNVLNLNGFLSVTDGLAMIGNNAFGTASVISILQTSNYTSIFNNKER